MNETSRRNLLSFSGLAPLAGGLLAARAGAAPTAPATTLSARERIRERYFPDVILRTQNNEKVRFYEDLIKDKIVTLTFFTHSVTVSVRASPPTWRRSRGRSPTPSAATSSCARSRSSPTRTHRRCSETTRTCITPSQAGLSSLAGPTIWSCSDGISVSPIPSPPWIKINPSTSAISKLAMSP